MASSGARVTLIARAAWSLVTQARLIRQQRLESLSGDQSNGHWRLSGERQREKARNYVESCNDTFVGAVRVQVVISEGKVDRLKSGVWTQELNAFQVKQVIIENGSFITIISDTGQMSFGAIKQ
ncbi:hypothetical protein CBL_09497 [Carabus blaptoides fortunei]